MGRRSSCTELHIERAYGFALLGYTLAQIADAMDVPARTVDNWVKTNEAFKFAIRDGRDVADAKVVGSLYNKAIGYTGKDGKYYPPDTTAMIFWLKNRQKATWRDKHEVEHSGEITYKDLTDEELEHRIAQLGKAKSD